MFAYTACLLAMAAETPEAFAPVAFHVHPTALISACDYLARLKAEARLGLAAEAHFVVGLVIGHRASEVSPALEILDCCEVKHTITPQFTMDREFVQNRHQMLKKVDPAGEVLGWFCFGNRLPADHGIVQQQFRRAVQGLYSTVRGSSRPNVAVLFHQLDAANNSNELPVTVYSYSSVDVVVGGGGGGVGGSGGDAGGGGQGSDDGAANPHTVPVDLALDPAERIAMCVGCCMSVSVSACLRVCTCTC